MANRVGVRDGFQIVPDDEDLIDDSIYLTLNGRETIVSNNENSASTVLLKQLASFFFLLLLFNSMAWKHAYVFIRRWRDFK